MGISIAGKIAVVTGASRGIGAGIARIFADEGATVICAARSKDDANTVVQSINDGGGQSELFRRTFATKMIARHSLNTLSVLMADWTSCATTQGYIQTY